MIFESKFNFKDKVWLIRQERESVFIFCEACSGIGKITLKDNKERYCPECYGRKGKTVWKELLWVPNRSLTIGQIRIRATNFKSYGKFNNVGEPSNNTKIEIEYMAYETGIDSGSTYYETNLFATIEEAKKECDKRNKP